MAERETVIDFTVPYYDLVGITIMMKRQKVETSLFRFLTVLEDSVWACILAAYFFTSLLMWIFDKFSPYSYQNNMEKFKEDEEKRFFNFKECLWFCMTSLTPQVPTYIFALYLKFSFDYIFRVEVKPPRIFQAG